MNRERAKELLPVIQAYAEGKTVQAKYKNREDDWDDQSSPSFYSEGSLEYRIKPEPEVIYVNRFGRNYFAFDTKESCDFDHVIAERLLREIENYDVSETFKTKKFIEVME